MPVRNLEQENTRPAYNQKDVRLLPELVAIAEFQKVLQTPQKFDHPTPTFLGWLKDCQIKLINLADKECFWLAKN